MSDSPHPERRLKLVVAYDGGPYHGWQVQPGLSSVQGELERAYAALSGRAVTFEGSGRTDAGVHALAQVAAITTENPIPCANLQRAMNKLLPGSIRVTEVAEVRADFHPRYDAVSKVYEYRIHRAEICLPFLRPYVHHFPYPLDEDAMVAAVACLPGRHDFSAFAAADDRYSAGYDCVRTLFEASLTRDGDLLVFRVRGSGFLKHMVRNLVGTLLEAGKGNLSPSGMRALLGGGAHGSSGPTAPPEGLFLVAVDYDR